MYHHDPERFADIQAKIVAVLKDARSSDPARVDAYRGLFPSFLHLASVQRFLGHDDKAGITMKEGITLAAYIERENPGFDLAVGFKLHLLFEEGFRLLMTKPKDAQSLFDGLRLEIATYRKQMPDSVRIKLNECRLNLAVAGSRDAANVVALLRALEPRTASQESHALLGHALCENGEYRESVDQLDRLLNGVQPRIGNDFELYPLLIRAKAIWLSGERDRASTEFRAVSETVQIDFACSFEVIHHHDTIWKLIEGTNPPKRPGALPKSPGIPSLYRKVE